MRATMPSSEEPEIIRAASKNDRRHITRHALGFYGALTMTGLYSLPEGNGDPSAFQLDPTRIETYIPALKWVISAHPILRTAIKAHDSESPLLVRAGMMDLRRHVRVRHVGDYGKKSEGEDEIFKRVLLETHDEGYEDFERVPPWSIVVLPLPESARVYIIFAYSHSVCDGRSGLVFHKTLLEGLQKGHRVYDSRHDYDLSTDTRISELSLQLPPPLEEACTLRITWSFLLLTLFGGYVPAYVKKWLGFLTPDVTGGTWTGEVVQHDPENFRTGAAMLTVPKSRMDAVLKVCRKKGGARFTGLLNQLIVRALSGALAAHGSSQGSVDNLIGQIVVDLRGLVPAYSGDMMLNCVSAVYEASPVPNDKAESDLKNDSALWDAARKTTLRLANSASTLEDQPIGLLKYLDKMRPWFLEKLGKRRDSSYEISNAVVFDPSSKSADDASEKNGWNIGRMVFSQPANVTSCPLSFSVVTFKGGDMVLTLNWQVGVLGVDDENAFAGDVLRRIEGYLAEIGAM